MIYETEGGGGITGHIAIVEGIFYDMTMNQFYVRIIEAISVGVCRSVLDDTRVDDKGAIVLRVNKSSLTNKMINSAVIFCQSQIGKEYGLDLQKDTSSSEEDWYCSELAWAAYKNQGLNLEVIPSGVTNEPGVTPRDLYHSSYTSTVNFWSASLAFTDISSHWAKQYIQYVGKNGLMQGTSSTIFSPNATLTRGMVAAILYRLDGTPTLVGSSTFSDVISTSYNALAISWAATNGIVKGTTTTTFEPDAAITRQQFATMLYRYAKYKGLNTAYNSNCLTGYDDSDEISTYAQTAMKWAVSRGIMTGETTSTLAPKSPCTRAQAATFMYRLITKLM